MGKAWLGRAELGEITRRHTSSIHPRVASKVTSLLAKMFILLGDAQQRPLLIAMLGCLSRSARALSFLEILLC
jgi:hypothetical protein